MKNNNRNIIITFLVIVVIVGLLIFLKPVSNDNAAVTPAAAKKTTLAVNMLVVKGEPLINKFFTSGNILANESVDLKNEAPGRVTQILFTEGVAVHQGQLLLKLNDDDLQAQLKKLQSSEKTAELDETRQKQLLQVNGISQSDYDNTVNLLNGIKADMENLKAQINKTEIKAPFDGVIGLRNISVGSYLMAGTTITTLQQINPVKIDFSLPEKYSSSLNKEATISFTVDGVRDTFIAKVYAGEPVVNSSTGTIELRAICPNPKGELIPGAFAHVTVNLQTIANAIMVPSQALVAKQNSQSVFVVKKGLASTRAITIGMRTDNAVQVTSGLNIGDTVITSALLAVKNDLPVVPSSDTSNK